MGILRMNNAYALGELKQTSARWDNAECSASWGCCANTAKSKGMNAGGAPDFGRLLRELLLKIFLQ